MSVIERAEQRLAEEERQHELGADNRYDLHYWAAYLDGARAQLRETKSERIEAFYAACLDGRDEARAKMDGPIITPCRGCSDYDGYGGCRSEGGCSMAKMEVQE